MLHLHPRKVDVVLEPGQFHFANADLRIGTLLGSCIAITFWLPGTMLGGMCHYLLPSRNRGSRPEPEALDGRYGDEAVEMFMEAIDRAGTFPEDYQAKLFGGGNQFLGNSRAEAIDVPSRNVDAGLRLLKEYGLRVSARHVGGSGPRQVILDLSNGHVWVRHGQIAATQAPR